MKDLSELRIYRLAVEVGEEVWAEVAEWEKFSKWSLGKQLVESADGIAATMIRQLPDYRNSAGEQRKFFRYALSSAKEAALWWWRAEERGLICSEGRYDTMRKKLDDLVPQTVNFLKQL